MKPTRQPKSNQGSQNRSHQSRPLEGSGRAVLTLALACALSAPLVASRPLFGEELMAGRSGKVCVGCAGLEPSAKFEVRSDDGTAGILVNELGASGGVMPLFEIRKDGITQFRINNLQYGAWDFKVTAGGFVINRVDGSGTQFQMTSSSRFLVGVGGSQMRSEPNGDLHVAADLHVGGTVNIAGTCDENSDRDAKENFAAVDPRAVLAKVVELPLSTWNFKGKPTSVRHIGPMAQDFHAAFGFGSSDRSISTTDRGGVALAAIQGLHQQLQEKSREVDELRRELRELRRLIEAE